MTLNNHAIISKAENVKSWRVQNINMDTMKLPGEDAVWEYITTVWPTIDTEDAEKILNKAMPD